jgi:glycosyltransferase involved in cell wall biosynthesis
MGRALEVRRAIARSNADFVVAGDVIAHKVLAIAAAWTRAQLLPVLYGSELRSLHTARGVRRGAIGRIRRQFVGQYFARSFGAICISRFVARELQQSALPAQRQVVVYPAVRPLVLTRPPNPSFSLPGTAGPRTSGTVRLLTIGRISERKNQLQVLRALVHLKDRVGVRCEYYILGNVDADVHTAYWRAIQAFIAAHGLGDQVFLLPGSSDEEKIDCIDACDVVVALSRTAGVSTEGFGISAIEGSARGKPVVVSTEGGLPETIIAGKTGFCLSPEAETGELAETLGLLVTSPDMRRRMGDDGSSSASISRRGAWRSRWRPGSTASCTV